MRELSCEWTGTAGKYVVTEDFVWHIGSSKSEVSILLEEGFVFDISIPEKLCHFKLLTYYFNIHEKSVLLGAAIHDKLLAARWNLLEATLQFYLGMKAGGAARYKRYPYAITSYFYLRYYRKYNRQEKD